MKTAEVVITNMIEMVHERFKKERNTLKQLYSAKQYRKNYEGIFACSVKQGIRIPLMKIASFSFQMLEQNKREKEYNKRYAIERVKSRLDVSFKFENYSICGLKLKMKVSLP